MTAPGPGHAGDASDYYQLLGIPYDASAVDIARAYRKAMKAHHPDRHAEGERPAHELLSRQLNEAYATLSRPDRKRRYDQLLRRQLASDAVMGQYVNAGISPDVVSRMKAEATQPYRRAPEPWELREQARATRESYIGLLSAFAALLVFFLTIVTIYALIDALGNALF